VSADPAEPGLWPIHGDGVLAQQGDLVLLIYPAGGVFTDRLLDLLADAAGTGHDGLRYVELITSAFESDAASAATAAAGDQPGPAAVAFGPYGAGTAIAVYGTAWAEVSTVHGVQVLSPGQPYGRLRCVLPSPPDKIRAGVRPGAGSAGTDRYLRLAGGIVRADALVYAPEGAAGAAAAGPDELGEAAAKGVAAAKGEAAAQAEARVGAAEGAAAKEGAAPAKADAAAEDVARAERVEADEVAEAEAGTGAGEVAAAGDAAAEPFISVQLGAGEADDGAPGREALPLGSEPPDEKQLGIGERPPPVVNGVYCKNHHFNDPEARYCAVCGIGMAQLTKVPQTGPRPPLGVLVLDDGSVFQLNADYVIGREPSLDASVANGTARPLRLAGASGLVSRIHARVELDGWQVYVCDLNSANGTSIRLPGEQQSQPLTPGVRTPLVVGAQVHLGSDYGFRYDSHRHR
jgi:FHA domain